MRDQRRGKKGPAGRRKKKPAESKDGGRGDKKAATELAEDSKEQALEHVLETVESLFREREGNLWGSMVKQTLKRKQPQFNESFHGYSSFNQMLEDAGNQGLLQLERDAKSGGYVILGFGPKA